MYSHIPQTQRQERSLERPARAGREGRRRLACVTIHVKHGFQVWGGG